MKILIADDERMARISLWSMLEELYPNLNTYEYAANGVEMLDRMKTFAPTLVILDIKMPKLNGLEALEQCRNDYPNTFFITTSGYSDFEFARKAISLGALEYLLKPVSIEDLEKAVSKVTENITKNNRVLKNVFDGAVYNYLVDEAAFEDYEDIFNEVIKGYHLYYICEDNNVEKEPTKDLFKKILGFCNKHAENGDVFSLHYMPSGKLCLVLNTDKIAPYDFFFGELCTSSENGSLVVMYGKAPSIIEIKQKMAEYEELSVLRVTGFICDLVKKQPEISEEILPIVSEFSKKIEDIVSSFNYWSAAEINTYILPLKNSKDYSRVFEAIPKENMRIYIKKVLGFEAEYENLDVFIDGLAKYMFNMLMSSHEDASDIIIRAKNYINANYKSGLSINNIADVLSISPAYFSRLFHQKTGEKYVDYVTKVRVEKAKEFLIQNPSISVKKLAGDVGYFSVHQFTSVFQKYTGMTPSEYTKLG